MNGKYRFSTIAVLCIVFVIIVLGGVGYIIKNKGSEKLFSKEQSIKKPKDVSQLTYELEAVRTTSNIAVDYLLFQEFPDGTKILLAKASENSDLKTLLNTPESIDLEIVASPQNTSQVFLTAHLVGTTSYPQSLFKFNINTKTFTEMMSGDFIRNADYYKISPDETRIAVIGKTPLKWFSESGKTNDQYEEHFWLFYIIDLPTDTVTEYSVAQNNYETLTKCASGDDGCILGSVTGEFSWKDNNTIEYILYDGRIQEMISYKNGNFENKFKEYKFVEKRTLDLTKESGWKIVYKEHLQDFPGYVRKYSVEQILTEEIGNAQYKNHFSYSELGKTFQLRNGKYKFLYEVGKVGAPAADANIQLLDKVATGDINGDNFFDIVGMLEFNNNFFDKTEGYLVAFVANDKSEIEHIATLIVDPAGVLNDLFIRDGKIYMTLKMFQGDGSFFTVVNKKIELKNGVLQEVK